MNWKLTLKKSMSFVTIFDTQNRVCLMGVFPQESNFPHTKKSSKGHTALEKEQYQSNSNKLIVYN